MSKNRPLILVTNDDGIIAPGIKSLVEIARELGDVIVVAPDSPQSGQGHAITIEHPLRLNKVNVFDGIRAYECNGTPVDCVKLAKNVILKDRKADLCLSGINHGSNASINIIYSGTMSAAMEACIEGIPSIGFSLLDYSFDADFKSSAPFIQFIIQQVLEKGMPNTKLLNVNIPNVRREGIKGIKICRQAKGRWEEEFIQAIDPRGQPYYWLTGKFKYDDSGNDTDMEALAEGYISIVPSKYDLTQYEAITSLNFLKNI